MMNQFHSGHRIRARRLELGLTQAQLGARVGLRAEGIAALEGVTECSARSAMGLAAALSICPSTLGASPPSVRNASWVRFPDVMHPPILPRQEPINSNVCVRDIMAMHLNWQPNVPFFDSIGANPSHCSVIVAVNDSCMPFLANGQYVIIDLRRRTPISGLIYLVELDGIPRLRQLFGTDGGNFTLHANNAAWPDVVITPETSDRARIRGQIIFRSGV